MEKGFVCNMVNWILGMLFRLLVADQRDVWSEEMARNLGQETGVGDLHHSYG